MNENPYQAPTSSGEPIRPAAMSLRRCVAAFFALACLFVACFCLLVVVILLTKPIANPSSRAFWSDIMGTSFCSFTAAAWGATAWAIWRIGRAP